MCYNFDDDVDYNALPPGTWTQISQRDGMNSHLMPGQILKHIAVQINTPPLSNSTTL